MKKPKATENKAKDVITKSKLELEAEFGRLQIMREQLAVQAQQIAQQMRELYIKITNAK